MISPISIVSISSISSLGATPNSTLKSYRDDEHRLRLMHLDKSYAMASPISVVLEIEIDQLRQSRQQYRHLDRSVLLAIYSSRKSLGLSAWKNDYEFGVNIGSSRGATATFEKYHQQFLSGKKLPALCSPSTTLGNISSWVAQDLGTHGPELSHSITCSTSLHALLNGIAWLNSGMSDRFLVGGSEAPLTAFTVEQMKSLRIYSSIKDDYPCRALDLGKTINTMVLGEAAASMCMEKDNTKNAIARITGMGYATEIIGTSTAISANALCFQKSMRQALGIHRPEDVDVIVTHTPGTIKGDKAEYNAIKTLFKSHCPSLTNNKWKIGHTLGASGIMSIEMAILMLQEQEFFGIPYLETSPPKGFNKIMVNSVGFGGNAVSILLEK